MVDIVKLDMTKIWASSGDKIQPSDAQLASGWLVQQIPRQTWNWFENRQDTNIAYMLQKGIPEWDSTTQYQANKSYVQRNNIVYKAVLTTTGVDPAAVGASWVKAFPESTAFLEAIKGLTVVNSTVPTINGSGVATNVPYGATGLASLAAATALAGRTAIDAQQANINLTTLSTVTAGTNALPYFTGTNTATTTTLTAFGRSLMDDVDASAARTTLEVTSASDTASAIADGLATRQPLALNLTALAGATNSANTFNYWTSSSVVASTALTPFARTILDDADAAGVRATIGVDSAVDVTSALTAGLATKQPLHSTLTALAGLATGSNQLPYFTGTNTAAQTPLTVFARSILDDLDAPAVRTTIGANDATNLTTGVLALARIPTSLTGINAETATKLQTARTINGIAFDGTANITLPSAAAGSTVETGMNLDLHETSSYDYDARIGVTGATATGNGTLNILAGKINLNSPSNPVDFLAGAAAQGANVGSLLVSASYSDRPSVPANGIYVSGSIVTNTGFTGNGNGITSLSNSTVLANIASTPASGIGSYSFLKNLTGSTIGIGTLLAGASISYSDTQNNSFGTPPGTWRAMSAVASNAATIFVRIS